MKRKRDIFFFFFVYSSYSKRMLAMGANVPVVPESFITKYKAPEAISATVPVEPAL